MGHEFHAFNLRGRWVDRIMNHIHRMPPRRSVLDEIQRQRQEKMTGDLAKRSLKIALLKRSLPAAALALLAALALAPSWRAGPAKYRVTYHMAQQKDDAASRMQGATYHGRDAQGQPYTVTASSAIQQDSNNVLLTAPQGDLTLKSGAWLSLKSAAGDYHQQNGKLDLSGGTTLYRNDGTVMTSPSAVIDMRAGTASGSAPVQVTGPFGTLQAQNGFTISDHGHQVTFHGPATLTLTQVQ